MKPAFVIIGLGNPGKQYENTRHNAGFAALDCIAEKWGEGEWSDKKKFLSDTMEARLLTFPILLVKPQTFMNRSGEAVHKIVEFYKLDPKKQMLVISDDIDLPLGELRFREKGGPGTHNGLKSIVDVYGEDFPRLRIGIGKQPVGADLAQWVLSTFSSDEKERVHTVFESMPKIISDWAFV